MAAQRSSKSKKFNLRAVRNMFHRWLRQLHTSAYLVPHNSLPPPPEAEAADILTALQLIILSIFTVIIESDNQIVVNAIHDVKTYKNELGVIIKQ